MTVTVDRRYRVTAQCTLFQPGLIASRGQGVVVAAASEVNAFDLANAELGALRRLRGNVVGWSDERTDRAATPRVEANPAQGPDVSHDAQGPFGERSLKNSSPFGPGHACLTCYR